MTRVVTPSRLHFGLLSLPPEGVSHWPDPHGRPGIPVRRFGGVGMMVTDPGISVQVERDSAWSGVGPSVERAVEFARQTATAWNSAQAFRVIVERCPPAHIGLGVGTQLGLAVARAVAEELREPFASTVELAGRVGRGERSGIGVHGFERGGFILDGGKGGDQPGVLLARYAVPAEWRVVLARPGGEAAVWAGAQERQAFARTRPVEETLRLTERMSRLLLLGILPALLEQDCRTFGEALSEYNQLAGRMFAADQGGDYASPAVSELVQAARRAGATGAGQSSWGPMIFAICENEGAAHYVRERLTSQFPLAEILITRACNSGARIEK